MRIWEHTVDELTGGKEPLPDQDVELPEFPFLPKCRNNSVGEGSYTLNNCRIAFR
jgi:hypothetical protein